MLIVRMCLEVPEGQGLAHFHCRAKPWQPAELQLQYLTKGKQKQEEVTKDASKFHNHSDEAITWLSIQIWGNI